MIRYLVLLVLLQSCHQKAQDAWDVHVIDASSSGADGVKLADINGDGLQDIATGWEEGGITKVYLHPGEEKVKQLWPSVIVGNTPKVEDAVFADMDNDGHLDVVSCTETNSEKIFVHFATSDTWLDPGAWAQQVLPASDGIMKWMYAEPLQVDGQHGIDLVAAGKGEKSEIGWFEAPADAGNLADWTWHSISPVGWIMSILLKDMDEDGDMDIVITDRRLSLQGCRWLENPGPGTRLSSPWQSHLIGGEKLEVMFMTMTDIDLDGVEEAVVAERTNQSILIYKKMNAAATIWSETVIKIPETTGNAKSVEAGDINGDGIPDLVLSTNTEGAAKVGLSWISGADLKSDKDQVWLPISGKHNAKYDKVELTDIDGDGDLDVLICEENYGEDSEGLGVVWYENPFK